jgi:LemA protein
MSTVLWVVVGMLGAVVVWLIYAYNSLVTLRNRVQEASSDIEVQQKRRYDLIPNLVETVKGYAKHERGVFEKVTEMRTKAMGATTPQAKAQAENMLTGALKSLFAVAENYPDLKANQNFQHLQEELVDAEDKIMSARRFYNANVRDLNIKIESFPTNLIAGWLKFTKFPMFDAEAEAEKPVKVSF